LIHVSKQVYPDIALEYVVRKDVFHLLKEEYLSLKDGDPGIHSTKKHISSTAFTASTHAAQMLKSEGPERQGRS
jgi:hypothetical protein